MDSFWGNIFKTRKKEKESIISILKKIPIFEGLSNRDLNFIEPQLHPREFRADEIIFHQGDPGVGMYIIEEGTVKIVFEPTNRVLAELGPGEFFGELALLDESPRSAAAIAKTYCKVWGMFQSDLFSIIERNPRLGVKITLRLAQVIGERLKRSNVQVQELQKQIEILEQEKTTETP